MYRYCPKTGESLEEVSVFARHWARLLKSSAGFYLELSDPRWQYPLLPLAADVAEQLGQADEEALSPAFGHIQKVDYKTISIVKFEEFMREQA